ncbi:MAG: RHS repeat-associated core domain-containing protein [Bryobacteraceae bacterium]
MREGSGPELLIRSTIYGESQPDPKAKNQHGRAVHFFDQAGVITIEEYDFKGSPLASLRLLAQEYKAALDWSTTVPLAADKYTSSTRFDALNRPISVTAPDHSVYRPTFNEANLLEKVAVNLRGAQTATPFVSGIEYNAKGQRMLIEYGNNVRTEYAYDPLAFRLTNLKSTRLTDQARLQDLSYTYDPAGNITHIRDTAQQTIYFNNQVVTPDNNYTYDALYRLIHAEGREHIGQVSQPHTTWDDQFRVHLPHPNDGQAMRRYTERYDYDAVGNLLQLIHQATNGNWNRSYDYNEPSLIEPAKASNRLSSTTVGITNSITDPYAYDAHGNMTKMPHLTLMQWDFMDQLSATSRQVVNNGTPETTYYVYDAAGQRVRKVTERQNGTRKNERTYLGGFEVYREYDGNGNGVTLERETLHVMDDQQRIALVETRVQDSDGPPAQIIRYQFGNHLGSASLELDRQAQVISYEEYFPYGSTSYQAVRSQTETPKRYRYTGMERDEESGFSHHTARYYAPWLGRWINSDPAGIAGGGNLFAYAFGNPVMLVDPLGTQPESLVNLQPDAEGNIFIGEEIIEIQGVAPPLPADEKARRAGTTSIVSQDEFERQRYFEITHSSSYKALWTEDSAAAYHAAVGEEAAAEYRRQGQAEYNDYRRSEAVKLEKSWRRIDFAAGVVKVIAGITVAVAEGSSPPLRQHRFQP